jgi:hypothetical protein
MGGSSVGSASRTEAGRDDHPGRPKGYAALAVCGAGLAVLAGVSCVFGLLTGDAHSWSTGLAWVSFLILPAILVECVMVRRLARRAGDLPAQRAATAGVALSGALIILIPAFVGVLIVAFGSLE